MADQQPTISRALLTQIIAANEVGAPERAYVLSHAGTANSGYSVGAFQLDLAHRPEARDHVQTFLNGTGAFDAGDMAAINAGFLTTGNPAAIAGALKSTIDAQFATEGGHSMIDGLDAGQLDDLLGDIAQAMRNTQANPRYANDELFKTFSDSDLFQALIGDNANQYGPPNTFGRYMQGQTVTVGGVTLVLGNGPWDFQTFASYESHYSYVRNSEQGARDMRRRRTNVVNILADNNALGDQNQDEALQIIQTTYQAQA